MLKDITLGQYFPGDTIVHRIDPRVKIILTFAYIVMMLMPKGVLSYILAALYVTAVAAITRIRAGMLIRGLRPIIVIAIFTALLSLFYTQGEVIWEFYFISVTKEGVSQAIYMVSRIVLLITGTSLLTYTASPIELTDGIEHLLNPLKKIKVPVHELAMMMTIALRFIPTLIEETGKIMDAQKARGADFESGNLIKRAKALIPILIPLFISAFRRADELAIAMECRLYHGGEGRTRMKVLKMRIADSGALLVVLLVFSGIVVLGSFGL